MANVCKRAYIAWAGDAEKNDQSDVLVVTTPGKTFVDIRLKPAAQGINGQYGEGGREPYLEWAFAGTSSTWLQDSTIHARWVHTVDSHNSEASAVVDEGILIPQTDGTTLETGSMPRTAANGGTGAMTDYEESWVDLPPAAGLGSSGQVQCVVLELGSDAASGQDSADVTSPWRGVVVRVGDYCQGILRYGREDEAIAVEQWRKDDGTGSWVRHMRAGIAFVPCAITFEPEKLSLGNEALHGEAMWKVTELVT